MDPEEKPRARMRWPFYVALFVVLVPVAYVLSIGPAVWMIANGYATEESVRFIYAPFGWLGGKLPGFPVALTWYLELWVENLPG